MKVTLKYTWDSDLMKQRIKCMFRHDWKVYQHSFVAADMECTQVVIAFKICKRCAKSKLIHILE